MGQGGCPLEPFRMPEGGRVAVNDIGPRAIFTDQFLAVDRHDPELLLRNEATHRCINRDGRTGGDGAARARAGHRIGRGTGGLDSLGARDGRGPPDQLADGHRDSLGHLGVCCPIL